MGGGRRRSRPGSLPTPALVLICGVEVEVSRSPHRVGYTGGRVRPADAGGADTLPSELLARLKSWSCGSVDAPV